MRQPLFFFLAMMATPALAQEVPFHQLIDESIGYANIGPGLLLVEDDVSSNVCRIDISDVFFFGYAEGDSAAMAAKPPEIVCVPSVQFSDDAVSSTPDDVPFHQLVDESIGYVNLGPGIVLIEDDVSSNVCRVKVDDVYFLAYVAGNAERMRDAAPTIICVPSPELSE